MAVELLAYQLSVHSGVVRVNTRDLTHEDSLVVPPGGGNCLNWVLGHLLASRNGLDKLLGREPFWPAEKAKLYTRGSDPVTAETALPFAELLADFKASQEPLLEAVKALSDEDLAASTEVRYLKGDEETVGSALATFIFHESYHVGQTGLLRRIAGKEGAVK